MTDMNNSSEKLWESCLFYNAEYNMVLSLPSKTYQMNYLIAAMCNTLVIVLAIILNSATIITYWRLVRLRNKISYFLIMVLSLTDLITSVSGHSVFALSLILAVSKHQTCNIHVLHEVLTFGTAGISYATLLSLNIERYLCIVHPIYHRTKVTKQRLLSFTVVIWFLPCVLTIFYPMLGKIARQLTTFIICLSIAVTIYIYVSIGLVIRRTAIHPLHVNEYQPKRFQNLKMTKSCAVVVGCTAICFFPYGVVRSLPSSVFVTMGIEIWSKTLTVTFPLVDSIVFFWGNPVLRNEARATFKHFTF